MGSIAIETKKMTELDQVTSITMDTLVLVHTANGMRVCTLEDLLNSGGANVPIATTSKAGIVKPDGTTITVKTDGTVSAVVYDPAVATKDKVGVVKPDGTTVTIKEDGTISAKQSEVPVATTSVAGIVKPDGSSITVQEDGTIAAKATPIATTAVAGIVKPDGVTLSIGADGLLQVIGGGGLSLEKNAGAHNSIYRGKYLGDSYTAAQQAAVAAGTFDDLYVGDYWTIGGVNYRIAGFDYYLNNGDTACTTHHMIVVPDKCLYTHVMNDTNTTEGGYYNSKMHKTGLDSAKTTAAAAFGSGHILSHREYLTNAVTNGRPSGGSWYDCTVELMSERMMYGQGVFMPVSDGTNVPADYTVSKGQLPLFMFRHDLIANRENQWLRDVITAAHFADVISGGNAGCGYASGACGVRPAIPVS